LAKKIKKKIIKRKKGKSHLYFTADTQAAIVEYQNSTCLKEREDLYNLKIRDALEKLVQNLVFVYGFHSHYEPVENLQRDCTSFLFENLKKWNPERGTKAFSYFNVVAKNWLIMHAKKRNKLIKRSVSYENADLLSARDKAVINENELARPIDAKIRIEESRKEILRILDHIEKKLKSHNEKVCLLAIREIFLNIDELDYLNKRAIFVYVREISGLNQKQLSVALGSIRKHYKLISKSGDFSIF